MNDQVDRVSQLLVSEQQAAQITEEHRQKWFQDQEPVLTVQVYAREAKDEELTPEQKAKVPVGQKAYHALVAFKTKDGSELDLLLIAAEHGHTTICNLRELYQLAREQSSGERLARLVRH